MALSFFRALNPISENSGITYALAHGLPCQNREMLDDSILKGIRQAFRRDYSKWGLASTFDVIVGTHYDLNLNGRSTARGGVKGLLDFLIVPLIARKLLADSYLAETGPYFKILAWSIGISFEVSRILLGAILTIALSPLVVLIHKIKVWSTDRYIHTEIHPEMTQIPALNIYNMVSTSAVSAPLATGANFERIKDLNLDVPSQYLCPMSLIIMTDPVRVKAHPQQRFEREWIERWIQQNRNNPLTRENLTLSDLEEDRAFKEEITQYIDTQTSSLAANMR